MCVVCVNGLAGKAWGALSAREKAMKGCGTLTKASEAGACTLAVAEGIDLT